MNPFNAFKDLLKPYISEKALYELPKRWNERHRFYHTTNHLTEILFDIEKHPNFNLLNVYEKQALMLAAFFHDVILEPKRSDNEEESIKYFISSFRGKDVKMLDTVCDLIKVTKDRKRPIDRLQRIFWESDNAKFKSGYDTLLKNEKLLRKEYSFLSNKEYKDKRIKFIKSNFGLFGPSTDKDLNKLIEYIEKTY